MENFTNDKYICPKCGNHSYETDKFQATGGTLSKMFDVQNKKFYTVSCSKCGYTELYKGNTSDFENILDFFINR